MTLSSCTVLGLENPSWFELPFYNLIVATARPSIFGSLVLTPLHCVSGWTSHTREEVDRFSQEVFFFCGILSTVISALGTFSSLEVVVLSAASLFVGNAVSRLLRTF